MPYSPLILFWIKGLLLSHHTPQIRVRDGFLLLARENAPPSHSKRTQAIPAGVRGGDAARSMISMFCDSELKRLSAVIRGISRAFSMVDFQAGERQCVKHPAGFTANGRADRISSRFDRICSFFRAYRLEEGSVSSTRIIAESVCQPYAWFRQTGGFFACLRAFPVCQVYTPKKSISLQPKG